MIRSSLVLAVALVAAPLVHAATPTPAQNRQASMLFGIDALVPAVFNDAMEKQSPADWTRTQRECVRDAALPLFKDAVDTQLGVMFETGENIDAWVAFSNTAGGHKMVELMQRTVASTARGGPTPDVDATMKALTAQEMMDITTFMGTPAAAIVKKGFPDSSQAFDRIKSERAGILDACGIKAG